MSTVTTANMGLILPVPTSELGPAWALELNNALGANPLISGIDGHDHTPGKGLQITPAGLNINTDLTLNQKNLTTIRSLRLYSNLAPITASSPDLLCLYGSGNDLYFNDGAGNQIRITNSGSVSGSAGTITGLPSGTASAAYQSVPGTFQFLQATSTAANIDVGTVIVRYPGSYPTPSGNYIALEAPSSLASGYALTLPGLPAQTNVMTLSSAGLIASITYDAVGQAMTSVGANAIAASTNNPNFGGKAAQESSKNLIVSNTNATNSLALVRGTISTSGPTTIAGEGFTTSRLGTGSVRVTFSNTFNDTPIITTSVSVIANYVATIVNGPSSSSVDVTIYNGTDAPTDSTFSFIAIGQRT